MSRDIFHQTRVLRAPSSLAWNSVREGAATASLGSLGQCFTALHVRQQLPPERDGLCLSEGDQRALLYRANGQERRGPQGPYELHGNSSQQALGWTHTKPVTHLPKEIKKKRKQVGKVTLDLRTDFLRLPSDTARFVLYGTT